MTKHPCKDECMQLIALSNRLAKVFEAPSTKNDKPFLSAWRKRADELLKHPELESVEGEQLLGNLSLDLRRLWLQHAHLRSDSYLMSPPHTQRKLLPGDVRISYPYDRWVKPEDLERRLNEHRPAPDGWVSEARVFSSGMTAITTFLQVFRAFGHKLWNIPKRPLSLQMFGGYFEIVKALQVICDQQFQGRKHALQKNLFAAVERGQGDLIFVEPISADINLEVFDMEAFAKAFVKRPKGRSAVIVLDTSLSGDAFPLERFCALLKDNPPSLIVNIRSGLKLDQLGLEFSNLGLMTLWAPATEATTKSLKSVAESLRVTRTTFGAGLSQDECAALSAPFILDKTSLNIHGQAVFDNNQAFAMALSDTVDFEQSFINKIIHPSLSPDKDKSWAKAPFVNIHYKSEDRSDRALLRMILEVESRNRNLSFVSGSSFGFRSHRFEMGFVQGTKYSALRVALGSITGPSFYGVIDLFKHLSTFKDFEALKKAYPELAAKTPKDRTAEES